jgi:hypothetical protein
MEKVCCEFKKGDDIHVKCVETDDGYRIEVKGNKEVLKKWKESCCTPGHGSVGFGHCHCGCC